VPSWRGLEDRDGWLTCLLSALSPGSANLYDEQELDPGATIRKFRIVQAEGKRQVARLVDQAERKLDAFLAFNERDVLKDAGRVSMEIAQRLALDAYQTFERRRLAEEAAAPDELEDAAKQLGPGKPGAGRRRDSRPRS